MLHDELWVRVLDNVTAEDAVYSPEVVDLLERLEGLVPLPDGFEERHGDLQERFMLTLIRSEVMLPSFEDEPTYAVGKGDEVMLESPAELLELIDDYETDRNGSLLRRKRWVAADQGTLIVTRQGIVFLGGRVHRNFVYQHLIQAQDHGETLHLHVQSYPDGMRYRLPSPAVVLALIERMRREINEPLRQTAGRLVQARRGRRKA